MAHAIPPVTDFISTIVIPAGVETVYSKRYSQSPIMVGSLASVSTVYKALEKTINGDLGQLCKILEHEAALNQYIRCRLAVRVEFAKVDGERVLERKLEYIRSGNFFVGQYSYFSANLEWVRGQIMSDSVRY